MSTYWYFECLDHDPPIRSREEFTQHTRDKRWDHAMQLANNRPVTRDTSYWSTPLGATDEDRSHSYFDMNARDFLADHPTCRLGIVSEYGMHYTVPAPPDQAGSTGTGNQQDGGQ
jgi:hypothetical protein